MEVSYVSLGTIPRGWSTRGRPTSDRAQRARSAGTRGNSSLVQRQAQSTEVYSKSMLTSRQGSDSRGGGSPQSLHSASTTSSGHTEYTEVSDEHDFNPLNIVAGFPKRIKQKMQRSKSYTLARGNAYNEVLQYCIKHFNPSSKWRGLKFSLYKDLIFKLPQSEEDSSGRSSPESLVTPEPEDRSSVVPAQPQKQRTNTVNRSEVVPKDLSSELEKVEVMTTTRDSVMKGSIPSAPMPLFPGTPGGALLPNILQSTIVEEVIKDSGGQTVLASGPGEKQAPVTGGGSGSGGTGGAARGGQNGRNGNKDKEDKRSDSEKLEDTIRDFLEDDYVTSGDEARWLLWSVTKMVKSWDIYHKFQTVKHKPDGKSFIETWMNDKNYMTLTDKLIQEHKVRHYNDPECAAWSKEETLAECLCQLSQKYEAPKDERAEVKLFIEHPGNIVIKKIWKAFNQASEDHYDGAMILTYFLQHKALYFKTVRCQRAEVIALKGAAATFKEKMDDWNDAAKGKNDDLTKEQMMDGIDTVNAALTTLSSTLTKIFMLQADSDERAVVMGFNVACDFMVIDVRNLSDIMKAGVENEANTSILSTKYSFLQLKEDFPEIKSSLSAIDDMMEMIANKFKQADDDSSKKSAPEAEPTKKPEEIITVDDKEEGSEVEIVDNFLVTSDKNVTQRQSRSVGDVMAGLPPVSAVALEPGLGEADSQGRAGVTAKVTPAPAWNLDSHSIGPVSVPVSSTSSTLGLSTSIVTTANVESFRDMSQIDEIRQMRVRMKELEDLLSAANSQKDAMFYQKLDADHKLNAALAAQAGLENEKKLMWENQQTMEHNLRKELEEEKAARIADTEKMNKEVTEFITKRDNEWKTTADNIKLQHKSYYEGIITARINELKRDWESQIAGLKESMRQEASGRGSSQPSAVPSATPSPAPDARRRPTSIFGNIPTVADVSSNIPDNIRQPDSQEDNVRTDRETSSASATFAEATANGPRLSCHVPINNHHFFSAGGSNQHTNNTRNDDYNDIKVKACSAITALVSDIGSSYTSRTQDEIKEMNSENLSNLLTNTKVALGELEELQRMHRNYLEKFYEDIEVRVNNTQTSVGRYIRSAKIKFNQMQDAGMQQRKIREEKQKNQAIQLQKNLGAKEIPELAEDGDIIPWLVYMSENFKNSEIDKNDLAASMFSKIKSTEVKALVDAVKSCPDKIWTTIMEDKIFNGSGVKAYFVKNLLRKGLIKSNDENNQARRKKAQRQARLAGICVATNLIKLRQENGIKKEDWESFNKNYCVTKQEELEWLRILNIFTKGDRNRRDTIIHQMRSSVMVGAIGLCEDDRSLTSLPGSNTSYANTSILDQGPLDGRNNANDDDNDGNITFRITPARPALSDGEYMKLVTVWWEMLNSNYKESSADEVKEARRNLANNVEPETANNDDEEDALTPAAAKQANIFLRNDVMPEGFVKPLMPRVSAAAMENYASLPCVMNQCPQKHPNGSLWFCIQWMTKKYKMKKDLAEYHKVCESCLSKHEGPCKNLKKIECACCKAEGRPYSHNIALCEYSRYRFGVQLRKQQSNIKVNLHLSDAVDNMDPDIFVEESEEDSQEDGTNGGSRAFILNGVPDGVEKDEVQGAAGPSETGEADQKEEDPHKGTFADTDFRTVGDLIKQLIQKSRECRKEISSTEIAGVADAVARVEDESKLLMKKDNNIDVFEEFEKQVLEAIKAVPEDIKVLVDSENLRKTCRFVLLNSPFSCISALKNMTTEKMATDEFYFNRTLKALDNNAKINEFKIPNTNKHFIVTRKNQKLFENVNKVSEIIHGSQANMAILNYVRLTLNIFANRHVISKLSKMTSVFVYPSVPIDHMEPMKEYECQVTIFLVEDTGCSNTCIVAEFLDLIGAEKIRECRTFVNTANNDGHLLEDYVYALNCRTRGGRVVRMPVQKLERRPIPCDKLSQEQLALIKEELGEINGVSPDILLGHMATQNWAMGLIGQNCNFIKMTAISEPRHIGFRKAKLYHPNLKIFETSSVCMDEIAFSGELGTDPASINRDSFLIIPKEYVYKNEIKEQFQIPKGLLRNVGAILDDDEDKETHVNMIKLERKEHSIFHITMEKEDMEKYKKYVNDEGLNGLCELFNDEKRMLTKVDAATISDFILAESVAHVINPLCKVHLDLSRRDAGNCIDCKVLSGNRQAIIDKNLHNAIQNNIRLEPNPNRPGKMRLRQTLSFVNEIEDLANIGASNLEASVKRFEKLVRQSLKGGFWPQLNKQICERYKRNEIAKLEPKEMEAILNGEIKAQFVSQSYVEAPHKATAFRIICDSSINIKGVNNSIAGSNRSPRVEIQSFNSIVISQRTYSCLIAQDLMRAYNGVLLDEIQSYLFCTPWASEPEKYGLTRMLLLRMLVLCFGFGSAGYDMTSGIVVHGVPRMLLEESRFLAILKSYVDNLNSIGQNATLVAKVAMDMVAALDEISMIVDKIQIPAWYAALENEAVKELLEKYPFIQKTGKCTQMGYIWELDSDLVTPHLKLNIHDSRRGAPLGPGYENENVDKIVWTRKLLSKLTPTLFDSVGSLLGIPIVVTKLLLSRVCRTVPITRMEDDIANYDKDLADLVRRVWKNIQRFYSEFRPMRRAAIPYEYTLRSLICSHDGSQSAYSSVCHTVSYKGDNVDSHILGAKSTCNEASPYNNEAKSFTLGLMHVLSIVGSNIHWMKNDPQITVYMVGDNAACTYAWGSSDTKEMLTRVLKYSVLRCCFELSDMLPSIRIKFCWAPASVSVSDYNSKVRTDTLEASNSAHWRFGPEEYKDEQLLASFTFLDYCNESWCYTPLPCLEGKRKCTFKELVELKNSGVLKPSGPSVTYRRGVGVVNSEENSCVLDNDEWLKKDEKSAEIQGIAVSKTTAFLCHSALSLTQGEGHQKSGLQRFLSSDNTCAEDQEWEQVCDFESRQNIHQPDEQEFYDEQEKYRINSQFSFPRVTKIVEITDKIRIAQLSDEQKIRYASSRITRKVFLKQGEAEQNVALCQTKMFRFNKEWCEKILDKRENLLFGLNVLKCVIAFVTKCKLKKDKKYLETPSIKNVDVALSFVTWRSVIQHEQIKSGMKIREGYVMRAGILCVSLRLNDIVKPVLESTSNLFERIVQFVHKDETGDVKMSASHLHLKTCVETVFYSIFGVYTLNMKKKVGDILLRCYGCRRARPKNYVSHIGPRYALSSPNIGLFAACSIDPAFQVYIKSLPQSRQSSMLAHILHVSCLNTGCSEQIILRGMTHTDVALALRTLEVSHNTKISLLSTDRGSNVRRELLEQCGSWTCVNHASGGQQRNFAESRIKLARGIWRNLFRKAKGEGGRYSVKLDFTELLYLTKLVTLSINSIPFSTVSKNTQGFSPAVCMYGSGLTEALLCESEVVDFAKSPPLIKYREYMDKVLKCRNEVLLTLAIQGESIERSYNTRNRVRRVVAEKDIVLWKHSGDRLTLAQVLKVHDPPSTSATIRYGGGEPKAVPIGNLYVLVPANSAEAQCLRERDISEMNAEVHRVIENADTRAV